MDDVQLCKEITRLKKELHKLVSIPGRKPSLNMMVKKGKKICLGVVSLIKSSNFDVFLLDSYVNLNVTPNLMVKQCFRNEQRSFL